MRIFGGRLAGMPLLSPGPRVRPSMERLRDACARHFGASLAGTRVIDLFAGTGALGLELVSQGAGSCDFIENGDSAMHSLKANVATFRSRIKKLAEAAQRTEGATTPLVLPNLRIFFRDAIPFSAALPQGAYDIALCDPPYGSKKLERILATWLAVPFARWLVIEHEPMHPFDHAGTLVYRLRIEDSMLSVLDRPPAPAPAPT
jgi:16S rRNA (guanine966-N2)-methyltransferase